MSELRQSSSAPWYRHRWPWILMAGPAIVIVAGFITAWLAIKSNDGLVEDNYYKVGLAVNQQLQQKKLAAELGLGAKLAYVETTQEIRISLSGLQPGALPDTLQLKLVHPTRKGEDQLINLRREGAQYVAQLPAAPSVGRWNVVLEDSVAGWRMDTVWDLRADRQVMFSAKPQ
ncbi:MAG: FixH family protein [Rhodocyclaceae bacterium]|jgi:hypothetical protein|nr:FixH family protein [Rhodocyclaceae bacterium]